MGGRNNIEQEKKINLYAGHLINEEGVVQLLALMKSQHIFYFLWQYRKLANIEDCSSILFLVIKNPLM